MADRTDVVVLGAGIAGLAAARRLADAGLSARVVDKCHDVGGRMATRRVGDATFDAGAQFFTTRSEQFTALVAGAVAEGAVVEWCRGFGKPDGYPRYRGAPAMTGLARWMAEGLDVSLDRLVTDLGDLPAAAYVVTAPLPQSLAILSFSGLLPAPELTVRLSEVHYVPTISVLVALDGPASVPEPGGVQFVDDDSLAFVADNLTKGVSATPAVTVHLSNALSGTLWDETDPAIVVRTEALVGGLLGAAGITGSLVRRWRYAGPVKPWPERTVVWGHAPVIALAGEAFGGPKVEGAYLSGVAAAEAVVDRLS